MKKLFYFVATVILVIAACSPEGVGMWLQYVDDARFSCDAINCWDESITH